MAVLLVERPMCLDCIAAKAGVSPAEADRALTIIATHLPLQRHATLTMMATDLQLQRHATERCRACGNAGPVYSLRSPD